MNSVTPQQFSSGNAQEKQLQYRSVSKVAVCCIVFSILGLLSFVSPVFVLMSLIALFCGIAAWSSFRKFPDELVGVVGNRIGLVLAVVGLVGGIAYHSYIYATEVPEGYERISFTDLKPSSQDSYKFAKAALDFDKKKVFVKGYTRPGDRKTELKRFIMVGDFGACCFGKDVDITDVIAVTIVSDDTVDYSYRMRKIGGQFRLHPTQAAVNEKDLPSIYYEIVADYVK